MKRFLLCLVLLCFSQAFLSAQTATPAQPADPNQPRPALPVVPDSITPPQPTAPVTNSAPNSTNGAPVAPAAPVAISIIADSSLRPVLPELVQGWADSQDSSPRVPLTMTNAAVLVAKVESGAADSGWDVVISADVADVKEMTDKSFLLADGQRSLARNTLVVYGRKALLKDEELEWFDLIGTEWNKVALGNPDLTASGRAAKRALIKHGLLGDDHKNNYVYAPIDRLAFSLVAQEKAEAVFLFRTDVAHLNLPGFEAFPVSTDDAPPVFYTASVSRLAKNPALARAFIDYCGSDAAKAVWAKYGFETN